MTDDDLERRLRGALSRPRQGDAADTDEFLTRVHHGAKVRRVKRAVSLAAASVLAVVGGGFAISASGLLGGSAAPVASGGTTLPSNPGSASSDPPGSTSKSIASTPGPTQGSATPQTQMAPQSVTISPGGPISASDVHPVSLTATGTDHQWVLAKTPGDDCGRPECATVFATADHGANWADLGQLPAPPASAGTAQPDTVSQLRFTLRTDGSKTYDAWAFGSALWSSHDSGKSWSAAGAPPGSVTQLESWGTYVYAGVSSSVAGDDTATLYRSPTTEDSWTPVQVSPKGIDGLTSVQALAAAKGVVGLIDSGGLHSILYVSTDGESWQRENPCPHGTDPSTLSTASDAAQTVGSLWVTCRDSSRTVIRYTTTNDLGSWKAVPDASFPPTVSVAAQSPTLAFVAGDGITGIKRVSTIGAATPVAATGVGPPTLFGFTNVTHGYLLDAEGNILSTTNGGGSWLPYAVSDTP